MDVAYNIRLEIQLQKSIMILQYFQITYHFTCESLKKFEIENCRGFMSETVD